MPGPETWLLVLARDPLGAKTRLSDTLDPEARAALAVAMLADVLAAARDVPFARRLVVTESAGLRQVLEAEGVGTLHVTPSGANDAAAAALRAASAGGAGSGLVLAADLPLLASSDLRALVAEARLAEVVIAPDRHRRGTNALLLTPPSVIAPAFGEDSFRAHRERARRARALTRLVTSRGLATDIDDADDLRRVLHDPALGGRTGELLRSLF